MSASLCPSDQPTKNLGCLSSLILFRTRTRSKNPTTLLGASSPVCASCGVIFIVPPPLKSKSLFYKIILNPFSVSHCPLCNRVIKYDLSTSTPCVLNQDLQYLFQRSNPLFCTSVCLTLFNCSQVVLPYCVQLHASIPLDHSTLECFLNVFVTLAGAAQDLRISLLFDERLSQTFLRAVQHQPGS